MLHVDTCTVLDGTLHSKIKAGGAAIWHQSAAVSNNKKKSHPMMRLSVCRPEMVVGWYHSHPGFGCWLSGVDINTQQVQHLLIPCCVVLELTYTTAVMSA